MSLSPLTRSGLNATQGGLVSFFTHDNDFDNSDWAKPFMRYRCQSCQGHHRSESLAATCCPNEVEVCFVNEAGEEFDTAVELASSMDGSELAHSCPICSHPFTDHFQAADCCLWKDVPAPKRWLIARAVEIGASWSDAITTHTKD